MLFVKLLNGVMIAGFQKLLHPLCVEIKDCLEEHFDTPSISKSLENNFVYIFIILFGYTKVCGADTFHFCSFHNSLSLFRLSQNI